MSTVTFGTKSKLSLRRSATGTWVDFTGVAAGTSNITMGRTVDARAIPGGRGVLANQRGNFTVHDFGFICDANSTHDPVLRDANGQRIWFRFDPEGSSSGNDRYTGEAVATVNKSFDMSTDAVTYSVSMAVDGSPTKATI